MARGKIRFHAGHGEPVPGAAQLAVIAAVYPVADGVMKFFCDHAFIFDGQIRNAASRIELVGCKDGPGRADVDAGGAAAAVIFAFAGRDRQGQVGVELSEKKPGTGFLVDQVGVLADPAETGIACQRFFQHRRAVDKGAVAEFSDLIFNFIGQLLQAFAHHLVVIPAQRIARDIAQIRIIQHGFGQLGVGRVIIHAHRDHPQSTGNQLGGAAASGTMVGHIGHFAVSALLQPVEQMGLVFDQFGCADLGLLKTEFARPGFDLVSEIGIIYLCSGRGWTVWHRAIVPVWRRAGINLWMSRCGGCHHERRAGTIHAIYWIACMTVRTRFAPSPTGYLHIGGARTALFSWLYARKLGGTFILRIEDTDLERSTQASVDAILQSMDWLGLDYDEGPYYQTQRFDRYAEVIRQLLDSGHAYHCNCSKERLEAMRAEQMASKQKPRYDGCCRDKGLAASDDTVVRFKNPLDGDVVIDDLVKGRVVINNRELDDLVIARPGGAPTYNLTVVVDDWDMKITHVIRGDDHLNNTPRQINILRALGAELPVYAHVPMILGADGKRLSKRHGAVSVMQYHDEGFLPDALMNYLVRLGWSHGDQEIFSRTEMIEFFDIADVNSAASTFNPEKLLWLNQQYIMDLPVEELAQALRTGLHAQGIDVDSGPDVTAVAELMRERSNTLLALVDESLYFYRDFENYDAKAAKKHLKPEAAKVLQHVSQAFQALDDWSAPAIHALVQQAAEQLGVGMGKVGMPLRVAVTGSGSSPSIDLTLALLGKSRTLARLKQAMAFVAEQEAA